MMKDKALEELFRTGRPVFDDKDEFMERLTHRLDAVEYLRQYEESTLRRYKYAMIATFMIGIIVGGGLLAFILSMPADAPLFTFRATSGFLHVAEQYARVMATTALSLLVGVGIVCVISNSLDIARMRLHAGASSAGLSGSR
ncbi:MAG: hypothetical protein PUF62_09990 [Bacteroidales bacterium]|nr:hypothetical protein [Bacteroidales bacterium]